MKRIAILFCILALLLTACSQGPGPETATQAPPTETAQTAAPTERPTEPPATESVTTEPREPVTTEPVPPEPTGYQATGSTTAGGILVYTDPSAYQPYTPPQARYTRLREGPLTEFLPSPDYGAVYPYVAARVFESTEYGSWECGTANGIMDREGRILTDGIYTDIKPMTSYDNEANEEIMLPFWIVSRVVNPVLHEESDESGDYSWVDADTLYGVISKDGSFALPCEYLSIQVMEDSFLCVESWEKAEFTVYDLEGRVRFTAADLYGTETPDSGRVEYGDGLYVAYFYYSDDEETRIWYCDPEGNRVLGPYYSAEAFSEGLAAVSVNGSYYGYIDKTGLWVINPEYDSANSFLGGMALVSTWDGRRQLLDRSGAVVLECGENEYIYRVSCGYCVYENVYDGSAWTQINNFYDKDGNFLYRTEGDASCLDENTFLEKKDDQIRVFRLSGEEQSFALNGYVYRAVRLLDGKPTFGYEGVSYNDGTTVFIPEDLSGVRQRDPVAVPAPGYNNDFSTLDEITGEIWHLCWNGSAWLCLSETGQTLTIRLRASQLVFRGDLIMGITDTACIYLDQEGNTVFCLPVNAED